MREVLEALATDSTRCLNVELTPQDSAVTAASLAASGAQGPNVPHLWITDHPMWVGLANRGRTRLDRGVPLAYSPVALVRPRRVPLPAGVDAPGASWRAVLGRVSMASGDPAASTPSALVLSDVLTSLGPGKANLPMRAALLRQVSQPMTSLQMFAQVARPDGKAFAASEQQLVEHNRLHPDAPLSAATPGGGALRLQYSLVAVDVPTDVQPEAVRLQQALTDPEGIGVLRLHGLRVSEEDAGQGIPGIPDGLRPATQITDAALARLAGLYGRLTAARKDMRLLGVLDVSGSMLREDAPGRRRIDVMAAAARQGMVLLTPRSQVGLWAFSSDLGGRGVDHRPVAPISELGYIGNPSSHAAGLARTLPSVVRLVRGDTGLYDTIWAAYQYVQSSYQPGFVNSVVVLTDGRNDDPNGGLGIEELMDNLTRAQDPKRPVRLILLGMTADADIESLTRIAARVGGRAYVARAPAQISTILADAVMSRAG